MKVVGIIAEYNPFHLGHAYQIHCCKEQQKADYVIALMSGDFVQRGTPAFLDKHTRAEMALSCGADMVLELPVRCATASAEGFAYGAVSILDRLGCVDELCFGSESGDIDEIMNTAKILSEEPQEYRILLRKFLKQGMAYPKAREEALGEYFRINHPDESNHSLSELLSSPNNILGIEYCKTLFMQHSSIRPVTLKRIGAGYHEEQMHENTYPSASGLRRFFAQVSDSTYTEQELTDFLGTQIPSEAVSSILNAWNQKLYSLPSDWDLLLHQRLLTSVYQNDLELYEDVSTALAQRIRNTLSSYTDFEGYARLLKTREMTLTRVRRALLHILLGLEKGSHTESLIGDARYKKIPYVKILGFRKESSSLLGEIRNHSEIPAITRFSEAKEMLAHDAMKKYEENAYVSNLYESLLCRKSGKGFCHEYQKKMVIL